MHGHLNVKYKYFCLDNSYPDNLYVGVYKKVVKFRPCS